MVRLVRRQLGLSLIEVLISAALMLMLMFAFYAIAEMLKRSQLASDARMTARQQLRSAVRAFNIASTSGCAFYSGTGTSVNIGGYQCKLPYEASGEYLAGDTVAVAVPVDRTRPTNPANDPKLSTTALMTSGGSPDGFCDNRYDIYVMTTRPMAPANHKNPNARQIVLMRWEDCAPISGAWLAPLTINLPSLGDPDFERTFDAFIEPLASDGFTVNYRKKGNRAAACYIHAEYSHIPIQGPTQTEHYEYLFNTRNMF